MAESKKKYNVYLINESTSSFEVELTDTEKNTIIDFFKHAENSGVPSWDLPSLYFDEVK